MMQNNLPPTQLVICYLFLFDNDDVVVDVSTCADNDGRNNVCRLLHVNAKI